MGDDKHKPKIDFRLVTTNISQGQPYVLPLRQKTDFKPIFSKHDMDRLFPEEVVTYMVRQGKKDRDHDILPDGYYFLPQGNRLPVIVATRMSLSYPVLLSAVRLWTIKDDLKNPVYKRKMKLDDAGLDQHWFSDGGITSNFPIHMFDAWSPIRPTFGIKLYGLLSNDKLSKTGTPMQNRENAVRLPQPREFDKAAKPTWTEITTLSKFLSSVVDTMQNYRDNTQSVLPGYRERIVQIYLADNEGGLNLNMPREVLQKGIIPKGHAAATMLTDEFKFEQHQWIRFRVLMAQLEQQVEALKASVGRDESQAFSELRSRYTQLLDLQLAARKQDQSKWYKSRDKQWCAEALQRMGALFQFMEQWDKTDQPRRTEYYHRKQENPDDPIFAGPYVAEFFSDNAPLPPSVLRVTPDL